LGSDTTGRDNAFPTVLFEHAERTIAPKAPVADNLRKSLRASFVFMVRKLIFKKKQLQILKHIKIKTKDKSKKIKVTLNPLMNFFNNKHITKQQAT
jgi:hypothetical protein